MPFHPPIRIVIADDHPIFRFGIKTIFKNLEKDGLALVGEAANGRELMALLKVKETDVVLMDVAMPEMGGIQATMLIKKEYPLVHTIALSQANNSSTVLQMVEAGAEGYLVKNAGLEELKQAIKTVCTGQPYFSPAIQLQLASQLKSEVTRFAEVKRKDLTKRELEILKLICEGKSSKEIAVSLFVSKRTIDTFRDKIMKKTGVKNVLQLLRYAIRNCLTGD